MGLFIGLLIGLFTGLFTSVQAQTFDPPLCERSPVVQLAILAAADVGGGCAAFDPSALQGITTLDLSDRDVRELKSRDFNGLGNVETLNLSGNRLESLPADLFDGLTGLQTLDLSDNELQSLRTSAFSGAGNLQVLDLSDNELQVLPWQGAFRGLGNLRELNLERNQLQGGLRGNRFTDLGNLRRLDLSDNRLEDLEADLLGETPELRQLDLRNNRLEFLRTKLFDGRNFNPAVVDGYGGSLLLSGNPGLDGDPQTPLALIIEVRARALEREKDCLDMRGSICLLSINVWRADVEAYLAQGAPFDFDFGWDAEGDHSDNPLGTGDSFSAGRRSSNNRDRVRYSSKESPPEISDLRVFFTSLPSLPQGDSGCGFNPCYDGFVIQAPTDNSEGCKLRPGCYRNRANFGHSSNAVDWSQTRVRDVRFVSTPEDSDGYGTGLEAFEIDVLFDRRIVVVEGKPELVVRIGSVERRASYVPSEDGSGAIRFRYRLSRDDPADGDGIEVLRIDRNGATIDDMLIGHNSPDTGNLRGHGGRFSDQKVQRLSLISFGAATASVREGSGVDLSFTLDPPRAAGELAAVLSISGGEPFGVQRSQHSLGSSGGVVRVSIPDNGWIGRARDTFTVSLQDSDDYVPADVQTVEVEVEEGVCDRTPKVRDALMEATGRNGCVEVTSEDLGDVVDLDLSDLGIERLNPRDFLGLSGLRRLDLRDNELQILPAGIFEGLAGLGDASGYLLLENNPGAPFDFVFQMGIVEIRAQGNEEVVAVSPYLAQGAPFDLTFKTENYDFRFGAGDLRGRRQEITLSASGSLSFIHDVPGSLDLPSLPRGGCGLTRCYTGFGFSSEGSGDTIYRYRSQGTVSVNRFEFTPRPQDADGYVAGAETIIAEVEFDDKVAVMPSQAGGMPSLVLEIGSTTHVASYAPASSVTNVWRFAYTPREDDVDVDGIRVASRDGLKLNGATGVGLIHEFRSGSVRLPDSADDTDPEHKVQPGAALSFDVAAVSARKDSILELPFNVLPVARSAFVVEYVVEGADFAYSSRIAVAVGSRRELIRIPIGADGEAFEVRLRPSDDYFLLSPSRTSVTVKAGICDRTPQVRDELLSVLGKNDCTDVSNQDLARVDDVLDLNDSGIASLRPEDFSGLTSLERLLLNDNRLQGLPSGLFEGLGNLGTLELRRNRLQSLRRDAFSGLGDVETLNLSGNRLESLPADLFDGLTGLQTLDLSDNELQSLRTSAFSGAGNLQVLDLSDNELQVLPWQGAFRGLGNLRELNLARNRLQGGLRGNRFTDLGNLRRLDLSDNRLEDLEADLLGETPELRQLDLRNNRLEFLRTKLFDGRNFNPAVVDGYGGSLLLSGNPGLDGDPQTPLALIIEVRARALEREKDCLDMRGSICLLSINVWRADVEAYLAQGAPFDFDFGWDAEGDHSDNPLGTGDSFSAGRRSSNNRDRVRYSSKESPPEISDLRVFFTSLPSLPQGDSGCGFNPCYDGFVIQAPTDNSEGCKLRPGCYRNRANFGHSSNAVDWSQTRVRDVRFVSTPEDSDGYGTGLEAFEIDVLFDRRIVVVEGKPELVVRIGSVERRASYVPSEDGSGAIRFRYRLSRDDPADGDGIEVLRIDGRGATIDDMLIGHNSPDTGNLRGHGGRFPDQKVQRLFFMSFDAATASVREGSGVDLSFTLDPPRTAGELAAVLSISGGEPFGVQRSQHSLGSSGGVVRVSIPDNGWIGRARDTFTVSLQDSDDYVPADVQTVEVEVEEGVCDRTPKVRDALMEATGRNGCVEVTSEDLGDVVDLDLSDLGIERLNPRDFLGLSGLRRLDLRDNELQILPAGIFEGLAGLGDASGYLLLENNPGAPFDFVFQMGIVEIRAQGNEEVVAVSPYLAQGAPFDLTFKTENYDFRFGAGDLRGRRQEITLSASGSLSFIHDVPGSLDLPSLPRGGCGLTRCYTGFGFSSEGSGDTIYRYRSQGTVSVNRFEFTPRPQDADGYVAGAETIIAEVEFDDKVAVMPSQAGGMPSLVLEIGSTTHVASYAPASSVTNVWRFAYTPREDDVDVDGIRVASRDGLKLNGATGVGLIHEFRSGSVRLPDSADDTDPEHKVQPGTALSFDVAAVSARKDSILELPFNVLPVARSAFVVEYVVEGADFAYSSRIAVAVGSRRELIRIPVGADGEAFEVRLRLSDDYFLLSPSRTSVTVKAGICDRTPQVRDELLSVLGKSDCADVSNQDLARVDDVLDLNDSGVASLRPEDFSGLTSLERLLLNDNRLQGLPSGLFEGLGNLGTLELRRNRLQSLRRDAFSGLGKLNRLRLQSNRLSSLPPGVFSGVGQAGWWLFLSDNPLSSLPPGVFSGTDGLQWLRLGNNAMTELPAGIFSGISKSLRALTLDDSGRTTFGLALRFEFAGSSDMQLRTDGSGDVDRVPVKLTVREGAAYHLRGNLMVEGGSASVSNVEIPPGATQSETFEASLTNASTFSIRLNNLSPLPENCPSWQRGADGRCFSGLEIVAPAPFTLSDVSADTSVCGRPQAVQDALIQLWGGNNCANVPTDLLRIATSLDLSDANLSGLTSGDFAGMASLERLDLSGSRGLQALGANAFGDLVNLKRLDLSSMGLRTLDPRAFAGLESLEQLLLHDNDLRELPAGIFSGLSGLGVPSGSLRVENNPDGDSPRFVLSAVFQVAQVAGDALDFRLYLAQGAPFELSFPLTAQGASSPAPPTMVIRAGSTRSETLSVTRQAGRTLRLSLGDPPSLLQGNSGGNAGADSGCGYAPCYAGFEIASGPPLVYDGTRSSPRITAVEFSVPRHFADSYVAGVETMIVDVIFDKALIVDTANGAPTLQLQVGRNVRVASYLPGRTDVDRLRFSYALASADVDDDGVHVVSDGLELNGATVRDVFGVNAALSLTGFRAPVADRKVRQTSWVSFETSSVRFREGVMAALSFRLDPPAPPGLAVGYRVGAPGDVADADDYGDGGSGVVSGAVAVGTGATRGTVRIPIRDDEVAEPVEEFFTVSLSPSDDYFVAAPSTARVAIVEGVCDRTPRVREALTPSRFSGCAAVTEAYLSSRRDLDLSSMRMATVKQGDFLGLTSLERLSLNDNFLQSLPEGVFSGLKSLEALHLGANPGSPFSFPLRVELAGGPRAPLVANQPVPVRLTLRHGAPYVLTVEISFSGGSSSTPSVTIKAGRTQSEVFFVTRAPDAMNLGVTLRVSSPPDFCASNWQQGGQCFTGFNVTPDDRSFRATPGSPGSAPTVCGRTPGIRDAILRLPGSPASCVGFPYEALGFAAYLDASNVGLSAVSRADLVPMIRLQDLDLSGNAPLQALGESVFADLDDIRRLDLSSGGLRELHPRAFAGLGGLRQLLLQDNDLQTLPAGIFAGLAGLGGASGSLRLEGNAPADGSLNFTLTAQLEVADSSGDDLDFYLYLAEGAPFDLTFPLTATGSAGSVPSTVGISVGSTRSETVRAVRAAGQTLRLDLGAAPALPQGDLRGDSGCGYDPCYAGFEIASGDPLTYSRALPPPRVTGVEFSAPRYFADAYLNDGADPGGETFTVDVIFDRELSVDVSNGEPRLLLEIAGAATTATYASAAGLSARLRFSYAVGCHSSFFDYCDSDDVDGVHVASADALLLDGAVVADAFGTAANLSLADVLNVSGPGVRTGGLLRFDAASVEVVEGETLELGLTASLIPQTTITTSYRVGVPDDVPNDMVGDVATADDYADDGNGEVDVGVVRTPIRISIRDDEAIEAPRERFTVSLIDSGSDAYFLVSPATVVVTIKEGVCDRTQQVRDALTTAVGADACTDVAASDLFAQTELDLSEEGIASLKGGDFSGLPRLRSLRLDDNDLRTLPAGIFAGLDLGSRGGSLHLRGNPDVVSPDLVFTVEFRFVRFVADDQGGHRAELVLYLAQGAPFDVTVSLVAEGANGSPVPSEATIPAGEVQSARFSVGRQAGETVTLRLGAPVPAFLPRGGCGAPPCYSGFRIAASETRFVYDDSLVRVERDLRLSFEPAAVVLRAGGSPEVVALTLEGNELLEPDETVVVTLTPSPNLEVRSESGESLTMVTLGRGAEATTRVRVSANRDADHATPDAESLNAAVALPNNARVAESTLRVTVAQREIRLSFEPAAVILRAGGSPEVVALTLEGNDLLEPDETVVVTLTPSPNLEVRSESGESLTMVTLGRGAEATTRVRVSANRDADHATPDAESLNAAVALPNNARVAESTLRVTVEQRQIRVLFEPGRITLVRGGASATVMMRTEPELQSGEEVVVRLSADGVVVVSPTGPVRLTPANNAVPVTLEATPQSSALSTVSATLDENASLLGNARVTTEVLVVDVVRGVSLSLSSLAGQDSVRFAAGETTEVRVTTDPVLEGDERVTVTVSVDPDLSLESAGKLVLSAMNPSATVVVTTNRPDLNSAEGVSASGAGENVGVVGGTASLRVRTDLSKKATLVLSPSPVVEVQQGGSAPLRVTTEPELDVGQTTWVTLTIGPNDTGFSFVTSNSYVFRSASSATITVLLSQHRPFLEIKVVSSSDAVIGNTAEVSSMVSENTKVEVSVDGRSRVTLEATTPQATIRFDPAPLELGLGTDKTVTLSFDDGFMLSGSQTAEFEVSVEGEGLEVEGGTRSIQVSFAAGESSTPISVTASADAVPVGRLVVRPVGGIELEGGMETASLPIEALQEVNLGFDPTLVLIPRSRSTQFKVAIDPPLFADRQTTVTLAISKQGFVFGDGRTQRETITFDAGKSSETVTVAATAVPGPMTSVSVEVTASSGVRIMGLPSLNLQATVPRAALDLTPAGGAPGDELVLNTGASKTVELSLPDLTLSGDHVAEFEVSVEGGGLSLQGGTPTPQVLGVRLSARSMTAEVRVSALDSAVSTGELRVRALRGVELADGVQAATLPVEVLQEEVSLVFDSNLVLIQRGRSTEFEVAISPPLIADRQTTVTLTISDQGFDFGGGRTQREIRFDAGKSSETVTVATTAAIDSMVPVSADVTPSSGVRALARLPGLTLKATSPRVAVAFFPADELQLTSSGEAPVELHLDGYSLIENQEIVLGVSVDDEELEVNPSHVTLTEAMPSATVRVSASRSAESGNLVVSALSGAKLVGGSQLLPVSVSPRELTVSFEPSAVRLVRGGAAAETVSTQVQLSVAPGLEGDERLVLRLTSGAAGNLEVNPVDATLDSGMRMAEVTVTAAPGAVSTEVVALEKSGTSYGNARVSFTPLTVEVVRGVELSLLDHAGQAVETLTLVAGESTEITVATSPSLVGNERVAVTLVVADDLTLPWGNELILAATNPSSRVRVSALSPGLNSADGVRVSVPSEGENVVVVGELPSLGVVTRVADEVAVVLSPVQVEIQQGRSAMLRVGTDPLLGMGQAATVRLTIKPADVGLSFAGGLSVTEVELGETRQSVDVEVIASAEAEIGSSARVTSTADASVGLDVIIDTRSEATLEVTTPQVTLGLRPAGGEIGEALTLGLGESKAVELSLTDFTLSGNQTATFEVSISGAGLSLQGGTPSRQVSLDAASNRTAGVAVTASDSAVSVGELSVRALSGVELAGGAQAATLPVEVLQSVSLSFAPDLVEIQRGRSTEFEVAIKPPLIADRQTTVILTISEEGFSFFDTGNTQHEIRFAAGKSSETVTVAATAEIDSMVSVSVDVTPSSGVRALARLPGLTLKATKPEVMVKFDLSPPRLLEGSTGRLTISLQADGRDYELVQGQVVRLRVAVERGDLTVSRPPSAELAEDDSKVDIPLRAGSPAVAVVTIIAGMPGMGVLRVSSNDVELVGDTITITVESPSGGTTLRIRVFLEGALE